MCENPHSAYHFHCTQDPVYAIYIFGILYGINKMSKCEDYNSINRESEIVKNITGRTFCCLVSSVVFVCIYNHLSIIPMPVEIN